MRSVITLSKFVVDMFKLGPNKWIQQNFIKMIYFPCLEQNTF